MSNAPPTPPSPQNVPPWVTLVITVIASILGGMHLAPTPTTVPPPVATSKATIVITDSTGAKYSGLLADGTTFTINVNTGVMTLYPATQPPNTPPPPPNNPPPTPPPATTGPVTVVLVYDKLDGVTGQLLQDISGINELKKRGHTWKPLQASTTAPLDPQGKQVVAAAATKGLSGSYMGIFDQSGALRTVVAPPAAKDLLPLIQANGGT